MEIKNTTHETLNLKTCKQNEGPETGQIHDRQIGEEAT